MSDVPPDIAAIAKKHASAWAGGHSNPGHAKAAYEHMFAFVSGMLMAEREAGAKAADDMAASPPSNDARHIDWQMGYQDGLMEFAAIRRGTP